MGLFHEQLKEQGPLFATATETEEIPVQDQFSVESITDMSELTNLKQRTKKGHMDAIKSSISYIDSLMLTADGFVMLPAAYNDAIEMCRSYLNNKNPFFSDGQRRKEIVRNTLTKLIRAREVFQTAMTNLPFYAESAEKGDAVTPKMMLDEASVLLTHDQKSEIELKRRKETINELKRPHDKKDSPEMEAVKTSYGQLLDLLTQKGDLNNGDYVQDVGVEFVRIAGEVLDKCDVYLRKGTPFTHEGKIRRSVVENILREVNYMQGRIPEMLAYRWNSPELQEINTLAGLYCAASKKYTVNVTNESEATSQGTATVTNDKQKISSTDPGKTEPHVAEEKTQKKVEVNEPEPEVVEVIEHQRMVEGKLRNYSFDKIVPKNLSEAVKYRKKILIAIEEEKLDGKAKDLFDYYSLYVRAFRKQENHHIDSAYLRKVKTTSLDLAARRRNRIINGGLVPGDLTEEERDVYDYYDKIVKELKQIDEQASEVVPHEKMPVPNYNLQLDDTLVKLYEAQASGSNDCWSCAGAAVINHFMKKKAVTQAQFRATKPTYLDMGSLEGIDDDATYKDAKDDVEAITTKNQQVNRSRSPMGNPFLLADRYFDELKKNPAYKNTIVKNAVFYRGDAIKRTKKQYGMPPEDPGAYHNLKVKFMNTVAGAIQKGSAIAMLLGLHYYTIVGIRGNKLLVHNSLNRMKPGRIDTLDIDKDIFSSTATRGLELTWLERMTDPEAISREYSELKYDKDTKTFTEGSMRNRDDVAHVQGMVGRKGLMEQDENIRALVSETVYVPKEYQP